MKDDDIVIVTSSSSRVKPPARRAAASAVCVVGSSESRSRSRSGKKKKKRAQSGSSEKDKKKKKKKGKKKKNSSSSSSSRSRRRRRKDKKSDDPASIAKKALARARKAAANMPNDPATGGMGMCVVPTWIRRPDLQVSSVDLQTGGNSSQGLPPLNERPRDPLAEGTCFEFLQGRCNKDNCRYRHER
eukprot:TRINITY_DN42183_c0_g1_i1.p1 TRINITY_DN42183_c0_g1~~TRINITY_DN42183_c0_g1_i1.p1  ORF type:complete len:187 (-),score=40.24 TRINITY_DN42183_c0_g1_i1:260-820(-)